MPSSRASPATQEPQTGLPSFYSANQAFTNLLGRVKIDYYFVRCLRFGYAWTVTRLARKQVLSLRTGLVVCLCDKDDAE